MALNKSLCELEESGFVVTHFKEYKKLIRYGRYVCKGCGRVARRKKNLCEPKRLYPKDEGEK